MKRSALIALLLAGGVAATAFAQQPPASGAPAGPPAGARPRGNPLPPPEPIEHIKGNVYKIFGGGGNTTVVVQKDGVVLVDTKMPGNGPAIVGEVKKVTDKPVTLVINTHSHPDHLGSNDYIRDQNPNVQIVMNEKAKAEVLANKGYGPKLLPTQTYTDHMTIGKGEDRVELYHFGPGHTQGDTFVFFPAQHVLCMGDVMAWDMAPFLPSGGASAISQTSSPAGKTRRRETGVRPESGDFPSAIQPEWRGRLWCHRAIRRHRKNFSTCHWCRERPGACSQRI